MGFFQRSAAASSPRRRKRGLKPRRHTRLCVEALEDRRVLSNGIFIENFSDDAKPQNPGLDSTGVFLHSGLSAQIQTDGSAPSPPHALALFGGPNQPHTVAVSST